MALSGAFVDEHIARWQTALDSPYYPHRKHWPARLFHHAPMENAIEILRTGNLRSRNDALNPHPRDVAAPGVIEAREYAHNYVRLYFRPKTPTQYHIEGIRKNGECTYGDGSHAPVLVMFALDARAVLTRQDIRFSDRNMQLGSANPGDDETYFSQIPFQKVFSEGGTGGDRSIIDARCAEVMTSSPLFLQNYLRAIYFRSEPERDTILHSIGEARDQWAAYCHVSDALKVFEKRYAFVQEVSLSPKGVVLAFNARSDQRDLNVAVEVIDHAGQKVVDFYNENLAARPQQAKRWIIERTLNSGTYLVRIKIESHLAYESFIPLDDVLF